MEKTKIEFGTDGFRGIIAKDFTFETVEKIIKAIINYLKNNFSNDEIKSKPIIIGFDPRFMARDFACFCAEILSNASFNVILSNVVVPTPIIAYYSKYLKTLGAIMFTASHNPKEYQGIKFIPNYAGPATKEITDEIIKYIDCDVDFNGVKGKIETRDFKKEYFSQIEKLIDFKKIKNAKLNIIFDGLYSASVGYFDELLLKNDIEFLSYNMYHSSDFGGGLPEPKPKFMKNIKDNFITLANDGDADRYGVIDEKGNYISPNIIMAILTKYLYQKKNKKGFLIKTVGVSKALDILADKLNIKTITTPVGFKWLSAAMRENDCLLAGEDSGGLSTGNHIPEKDGIYANLLILEAMANENKTLNELVNEINDFIGIEFFNDRVDLKLKNIEKANEIIEEYKKLEINDNISDFKIKEIIKLDGIKFLFSDETTSLLIRKSGTEPLLRFYIESDDKEKIEKLKDYLTKSYKEE